MTAAGPDPMTPAADRGGRAWSTAGVVLVVSLGCILMGVSAIVGTGAVLVFTVPIAFLVFWRAPGVLLGAYLLIPYYKLMIQPFVPIDITLLLAVANAAQIVPLIAERKRSNGVSAGGVVLWFVMGMIILAGVLYSPDPSLGLGRAINALVLIFIALLPAALRVTRDERYVRQLLWTFLLVGAATVITGVTQQSMGGRLSVFGQNTIQTARGALLVPILTAGFVLRTGRWPLSIVAIVLSALSLYVALASGSRGPLLILGLLAILACIRYFARPRDANWRVVSATAILLVTGVAVVGFAADDLPAESTVRFRVLGEFVESALEGELSAGGGDTSSQARVLLFGLASEVFADNALIGAGTGGFEVMAPREVGGGSDVAPYPHNAFLQIAADHGLLGLFTLATLLVLAFSRHLARSSDERVVRTLLLSFLLNTMVSGNVLEDRALWGLLIVLLLANTGDRTKEWVRSAEGVGRSPAGSPLGSDRKHPPVGHGTARTQTPVRSRLRPTALGEQRLHAYPPSSTAPSGRAYTTGLWNKPDKEHDAPR